MAFVTCPDLNILLDGVPTCPRSRMGKRFNGIRCEARDVERGEWPRTIRPVPPNLIDWCRCSILMEGSLDIG